MSHRRENERGAAVGIILAGIILLGSLAFVGTQVLVGPTKTTVNVTNRNETRSILRTNAEILLAEGAMDTDDVRLPLGMETATIPVGFTAPTGGGVIPASSRARETDPYSTPYGYCAWDNGNNQASANHIAGTAGAAGSTAVLSSPQLAVISAGPDGVIDTTCVQAGNNNEQNDDLIVMMTVADAFSLAALWEPGADAGTITYGNRVGINQNPPDPGYNLHVNGATYLEGATDIEGAVDMRANVVVGGNITATTGTTTLGTATLGTTGTGDLTATTLSVTTGPNAIAGATTIGNLTATTADINAGTIDGTTIGGTAPAAASVTTLNASGLAEFDGAVQLDSTTAVNGAMTLANGVQLNIGTTHWITEPAAGTTNFETATGTLNFNRFGGTTMMSLDGNAQTVSISPANGTSLTGGLTLPSGNLSLTTGNLTLAAGTFSGDGSSLTGIPVGGDLTGTVGSSESATVTGLQGRGVSAAVPGSGEVLSWNGTAWAPASLSADGGGGDVTITEADPQVGAVTNGNWCRGDGSAVQCDQTAPPSGSGTTNRLTFWSDATTLGSAFISLSGTEADFTSGGSGGILTDYLTYSSDERFKENWKPFVDVMSFLRNLRVGSYDWNKLAKDKGRGGDERSIGVVAQEVEALEDILPGLVRKSVDGYLSVDYARLTVPLLAAVQQLDDENKKLKAENAALAARMDAIEKRLAALEN